MDLNALNLLVEIVEAGNLSEAARRLRMSRANVSFRLAQFERSLGQQLLRRTPRRGAPTLPEPPPACLPATLGPAATLRRRR